MNKPSERAPDLAVTSEMFFGAKQPFVYHWKRGRESLYVGHSGYGWQRLMAQHKYINNTLTGEALLEGDVILLYYFPTKQAACAFERALCAELSPRYNSNNAGLRERKTDFRRSAAYREGI